MSTGTLSKKWDPKHLEIKTLSVENTLTPLVMQVSCQFRMQMLCEI